MAKAQEKNQDKPLSEVNERHDTEEKSPMGKKESNSGVTEAPVDFTSSNKLDEQVKMEENV